MFVMAPYAQTTVYLCVIVFIHLCCGQTCPGDRGCYPDDQELVWATASAPSARTTTANSTCGDPNQTIYMSLDTNDTANHTCASNAHPKEHMIDKDNKTITIGSDTYYELQPIWTTYWQSQNTVDADGNRTVVEVVVNFTDVFLISEVQLYFAAPGVPNVTDDARPAAMYMERYLNGNWTVWRYFAENCNDFPQTLPSATDPITAFCTQMTRGDISKEQQNAFRIELHPANEYNTAFRSNRTVGEYYTASAVRVTLIKPASPTPLRSYYAIADIKVDGTCHCLGHSATCTGPNMNECVCSHNTEGANCEKCKPLFNNKPWSMGTPTSSNACEACSCNSRAGACVYNATKGHGICTDCTGNTAGDNCTDCKSGYFSNPSQMPGSTVAPAPNGTTCKGHDGSGSIDYNCNEYCIPCNCSGLGSMQSSGYKCDTTTGQCECKSLVQGRTCDECKDGYHTLNGLLPIGCTACSCDPVGTYNSSNFCDKQTGQCVCKNNTQGSRCDACKPETYNLQLSNVEDGCTSCACDVGAAVNNTCHVTTGDCTCRSNIEGQNCTAVKAGFFVPRLDYFTYDVEFGTLKGGVVEEAPGHGQLTADLTGTGYVQLAPGTFVDVEVQLPPNLIREFKVVVRYKSTSAVAESLALRISMPSGGDYTCEGTTITAAQTWSETLSAPGPVPKSSLELTTKFCATSAYKYIINVTATAGNTGSIMVDSVVLLPDIIRLSAYINSSDTVKSEMDACHAASKVVDVAQQQSGNCSSLEYSIMAEFVNGAIPCACGNGTVTASATMCNPMGGQCECREGMIMRDCSLCQVDSYGTNCSACNCNRFGSVKLSCNGTGVCTCQANVTGSKCTACLPNHYGLVTGNGCSLCTCNMDYSANNSCSDNGQCSCKPGVGGLLCDQCLDGFFNLTTTGCTSCGCEANGSNSNVCNKTSGVCPCRANVQGDKCMQCKEGFYGLGSWTSDGCLKCECSGHSSNCTTATGWYLTRTESHWTLENVNAATGDRWTGKDDQGNNVTVDDPLRLNEVPSDPSAQYVMRLVNSGNNINRRHMYFVAPAKFLGNKKTAYGLSMTIQMQVNVTEVAANKYKEGDVLLQGMGLPYTLTTSLVPPTDVQIRTYVIRMHEDSWMVNSTDGQNATYEQMIQTLTELTSFRIRAKFSNATDAASDLFRVVMEHATNNQSASTGTPTTNVEQCVCSVEYAGSGCEKCAGGYRRTVAYSGPPGVCDSCQCNKHAVSCDQETSVCTCRDNTTGPHCETCLPGFYGNPLAGTPGDCKPCTCPGNVIANDVNVFAMECSLNTTSGGPTCINCTVGHEGEMCESCIQTYYGQPANVTNNDGKCRTCSCNSRSENCDRLTGTCIDCRDNTTGQQCEECAPSFFGDPSKAPCTPCTCTVSVGATGECDNKDGRCKCKPNVEGFQCDKCVVNAYNYSSGEGCTMCDCHNLGATSQQCNITSGICPCRTNVNQRRCDSCADAFWNINVNRGCDACLCDVQGMLPESAGKCNLTSGQCTCKNSAFTGIKCNTCSPVFFGTYTYINLFSLGSFPNCGLCGQCFDGWAKKIDALGTEVYKQFNDTDQLWRNYNRWKVSDAAPKLASMRSNISLAQGSIQRAGNFTQLLSGLQADLQKVSDRVANLSSDVDRLQLQYNTANATYNTLRTFTGTVDIDNATSVSEQSLEANVRNLSALIGSEHTDGNTTWQEILKLSILVGSTGDQSRVLQYRVDNAMRELAAAMQTFNLMINIYNASFLYGYNTNENALTTAKNIVAKAESDYNRLIEILNGIAAQNMTSSAIIDGLSAQSSTHRDNMAAVSTSSASTKTLATQVLQEAKDTLAIVNVFLAAAQTSKANLTTAFQDVILGIESLNSLMTKLTQAEGVYQNISAITLRPQSDMAAISSNISTIIINMATVDSTNQKADEALVTAQQAMVRTQKARDDSQQAKEEVEGIQTALSQAATLKTEVMTLKQQSDAHNQTIYNVLGMAQAYSSQVTSLATLTSSNINNIETFIASINQCITDSTLQAGGLRTAAQSALDKATEAEQGLSTINSLTSAIYSRVGQNNVSAPFNIIDNVNNDMTTLETNFNSVESTIDLNAMLQKYLEQLREIELVKTQMQTLETELDDLIVRLDLKTASTTSQCSN
ncbi:laminin subunit gamma-1-like [Haliotis rufescens]|uniref:laminin subunit gamma-1-like n=1 Tax=Haliotis rufescens TaxID=6454 RepID=UPI00201E7B67|nr:laminin subunit gamma-1-like [Haliotis rufescens]